MSTIIDELTETPSSRSAHATHELCEALGVGQVKEKDLTLLTIALAEAGAHEVKTNPQFGEAVRRLFQDLQTRFAKPRKERKGATKSNRSDTTTTRQTEVNIFETLEPHGSVDLAQLRPHGVYDPYALCKTFGKQQAMAALMQLSRDSLKQSAAIVEQRNPRTKPTNRGQIASLLAYIEEQL